MTIWEYLASLEKKKPPVQERVRLDVPPVQPAPPFDPFNPNEAPYFQTFPEQFDPFDELKKTRPRIVANPQGDLSEVPTENRPTLTQPPVREPVDELAEAEDRVKLLYNSPVKNNDRGALGRVGDVLRQAVISAGQAYDKNLAAGMNPKEALISSAGGAVAGGLYGGFHPEVDEERQRLFDVSQAENQVDRVRLKRSYDTQEALRAALLQNTLDKPEAQKRALAAKIQQEELRQKNRLAIIERQADIKSGEAKLVLDADGKWWKEFLKPDSQGKFKEREPVVNPLTGEQEFAPGEQEVDWVDPLTGNTIKTKAKQVLMPGATLAAGNAQREQQANIFNATKEFEAQKENAQNTMAYNKIVVDRAVELAKASGESEALLGATQGLRQQVENTLNEYNSIQPDQSGSLSDEQIERKNKLGDKFNELNTKLYAEVGKYAAGKQAIEQMKGIQPKLPARVVAPKIQATKVGGGVTGKTTTRAMVEAFAKKNGISYEEALKKAQADGYTVQ